MKRTMEALNTAQHKAAEVLYRAANAPGAPGGPGGQGEAAGGGAPGGETRASGDVIDAEVVEEEKK